MPNIRSRSVFAERLWDWEFLNPCFMPTRIRFSDVDGEVERNGFFFRIEGKPLNGQISTGQRICFDRLLQIKTTHSASPLIEAPVFTILILYGEPSVPERMQVWPHDPISCNERDVQDFVRKWFEWASFPFFESL